VLLGTEHNLYRCAQAQWHVLCVHMPGIYSGMCTERTFHNAHSLNRRHGRQKQGDSMGIDIKVTKSALKRALTTMARVADRRSSMPMLAQVLITASVDGTVTLAATDLNVSATATIPATFTTSPGSVTVGAKQLADLVKKLPTDEVSIRATDTLKVRVESGAFGVDLAAMHARDFPKVATPRKYASFVTIPCPIIAGMIAATEHAVCRDETRFHLNGILLESTGQTLRMVATDGHRLAKVERTFEAPELRRKNGAIIPAKAATEIAKLVGKDEAGCAMALDEHMLFVRHGSTELALKLIDAQFPPYEQVIPKDNRRLVTVERDVIAEVLERAKVITKPSRGTRGAKLSLASGKLTVSADHPDLGGVSETMDAECNPGDFAIGFNPEYLLQALAVIDCKHVTFALGDDLAPGLVRGTDDAVTRSVERSEYLNVIMPMRI
jgi:DNA polymerase-3 subunit beta